MAVPVLAEEGGFTRGMDPEEQATKDQCLLVAMNCADQVDTYQQKIDRIQNEIKRGTDVYTNDELKRLQDQLDDATKNFNDISGGA
jgi:hypothetical protein